MNIAVIIQARMGSTRLPGKVLLPLGDRSVLGQVISRVSEVPSVTQVCVATTISPKDDPLVEEAEKYGAFSSRGSEEDVLSRYYDAAVRLKADHVVRITSDCPLIDPDVMEEVVRLHLRSGADYTSNVLIRHFPRGLDTEVFTMKSLYEAYTEAKLPFQREHVTPFINLQEDRYRLEHYFHSTDYSRYRWTLDTPEDYELLSTIFDRLYKPGKPLSWLEAIGLMEREPELPLINADVEQKKLGV